MSEVIAWPHLIVLMSLGNGHPDSFRGEVHERDAWQVVDDEPDLDTFEHPVLGRMQASERRFRVYRRGNLVRTESLDGTPNTIRDSQYFWAFSKDDVSTPTVFDMRNTGFVGAGPSITERPALSRWEGNDFTRLTGPIEATTFLGRPAWAFELAPPSHKPYPLQVIVDQETGLVLREANADFGTWVEWTSLETDVDLADELFAWSGPTRTPVDRQAEHERDMLRRQEWLAGQGVAELRINAPLQLMPHEWDESGAFFASVESRNVPEMLARRRRSEEPWPVVDGSHFEATYRFVEGDWEWFVAALQPLPDAVLNDFRAQLRRL